MVEADFDIKNLEGSTIDGQYRIEAKIDAGIDGVVYLAQNEAEEETGENDVPLVIKIENMERSPVNLQRFEDTCQLVKGLAEHDNVAAYRHYNTHGVLDLNGNEHAVSYTVMEHY